MALDKRKNMAKVAKAAKAGGRMSTKEKNIKEKTAFAHYVQGDKSLGQIARDLAINPTTVQAWCKKYNWVKRKQVIDDKVSAEETKEIVKFKKQQIKVIMSLMQKVYSDIKSGDRGNSKDYLMLQEKLYDMTGSEKEEGGFKLIILKKNYDDLEYLKEFIKTTITPKKFKKFEKDYKEYKNKQKENKEEDKPAIKLEDVEEDIEETTPEQQVERLMKG